MVGGSTSRYETILKLASGGMATVWVGTVRGALGFRQLVAIKKPHEHLLATGSFRAELLAEARLASMINHANVVDVRDVEIDGEAINLVMDYIEGASLAQLLSRADRAKTPFPARVGIRIVLDALAGLHAAHELVDERGLPVHLVHRDVSPHNILVGLDGIARVADFGVAKFAHDNTVQTTAGSLKGKIAYMAPEYVRGQPIDRRLDIFAMGVVLWESLTGRRCFRGENEAETVHRLINTTPTPASKDRPEIGERIDAVISCALAKAREDRFSNAAAMAAALEASAGAAGLSCGHTEVAATVKAIAGPEIEERRAHIRARLAADPSARGSAASIHDGTPPPPPEPAVPQTPPISGPPAAEESSKSGERMTGAAFESTPEVDPPLMRAAAAPARAEDVFRSLMVGAPKPNRVLARTLVGEPKAPAGKIVRRKPAPVPPAAPGRTLARTVVMPDAPAKTPPRPSTPEAEPTGASATSAGSDPPEVSARVDARLGAGATDAAGASASSGASSATSSGPHSQPPPSASGRISSRPPRARAHSSSFPPGQLGDLTLSDRNATTAVKRRPPPPPPPGLSRGVLIGIISVSAVVMIVSGVALGRSHRARNLAATPIAPLPPAEVRTPEAATARVAPSTAPVTSGAPSGAPAGATGAPPPSASGAASGSPTNPLDVGPK